MPVDPGRARRPSWALILHGGAKDIVPDKETANRAGCLAALAAGQAVLERDGTALDAVEAAIRALEDDPTFNAGYGSVLNSEGEVEMDAALMEGGGLHLGAVAAIQGVRHPVSVARLVLPATPILLVGAGAGRFAAEHGAELCDPRDLIAGEQDEAHDTVGCVALDRSGTMVAGTSTGGLHDCLPGRTGDSPLPGCGLYADDEVGAVCFSGDGEAIARVTLAAYVMAQMREHGPDRAVELALERLGRVGGEAGGVALDREGRVGWAHNSSSFAVAWATSEQTAQVCLRRDERREAAHHG